MSTLFRTTLDGHDQEQYTALSDGTDSTAPNAAPPVVLRPYQQEAVAKIYEAWEASNSTLLVLPTGTGKTQVFADVIRRRPRGRALVLVHREELLSQAVKRIRHATHQHVEREMAGFCATGKADADTIVVATVQTLTAGMNGDGRMVRFDPRDFSVLVTDEAHHATADSYRRIYRYFQDRNPDIKHLGVTATPDRADEEALGQVFDSVAYDYELDQAIKDGWLVSIRQRCVHVEGLDYSAVRTTAGDLNGADLAAILEAETPLHRMAQATVELCMGLPPGTLTPLLADDLDEPAFHARMRVIHSASRLRKTLVFTATVAQAERFAEVLNRWLPDSARWLCGRTPTEDRRAMLADYERGKFAVLVNVGVATEGFDEPSIGVVVLGRPTKSRCLYAQMVGRGTRALPGVVDGPATAEARRAAIAASGKPCLEVLDFVGNCGRHRLVTTADILGGNYTDEEIDKAREKAEKADGQPVDMDAAMEEARREIEEAKRREAARRAKLRVGASYAVSGPIDPFDLFGVTKYRERGWEKSKPITEKMRACLERQKLWRDDLTYSLARQLIQGMADRRTKGLCTFRQAQALAKRGLPSNVPFETAGRWMDLIANNGWQVPQAVLDEAEGMST